MRNNFVVLGLLVVSIYSAHAAEDWPASPLPAAAKAACWIADGDIASFYEGSCLNGKANGYGKASGRDIFVGGFKDGKKEGYGIYYYGKESHVYGQIYKGQYSNDLRNGHGSMKMPDGGIYNGEYKDGLWHGKGRLTFGGDHSSYDGQFALGERTGIGTSTWANGENYKGGFLKGKFNGNGHWSMPLSLCPNAEKNQLCIISEKGKFSNGRFLEGHINFSNGDEYDGPLLKGKDGRNKLAHGTKNNPDMDLTRFVFEMVKGTADNVTAAVKATAEDYKNGRLGAGASSNAGTAILYCSQTKGVFELGEYVREALRVPCTGDGMLCVDTGTKAIEGEYISTKRACEKLIGYDWWPKVKAAR